MKQLLLILVLALALAAQIAAQESRHEITKPAANPADDTKGLSSKVPDVYAIPTQFDRVVVLRFKFDTDLLAGLEKMVKQEKISNAIILSGMGSVRGYHVHQVSNRTFPAKNMFVKNPTEPADIIGMSGFIANGIIHPHITLATPDKAFGGHLEPGTNVFTFAVVTIGVLKDGADLSHLDDKNYR
jgi:predicted DNA-binding protein with PD1-like motif